MRRGERLTEDGLPVDAREWTADDWRDLHEAIETVKRKVSERHARKPVPTNPVRDLPPPEPDTGIVGVPDVHPAG